MINGVIGASDEDICSASSPGYHSWNAYKKIVSIC
jgi:hypothetical protein